MGAPQYRRPKFVEPATFDQREGGADPAVLAQAARDSAHAIVYHARDSDDPEIAERFVKLAETEGIEAIAELWADSPPRSLAGSLWRLYAIRSGVRKSAERTSEYYRLGRSDSAPHAIAGVAEPPTAEEMTKLADLVLAGMYSGDIDVAFDRAAAFCRVLARGQALWAERYEPSQHRDAQQLTARAAQLLTTADDLEGSARAWRSNSLD